MTTERRKLIFIQELCKVMGYEIASMTGEGSISSDRMKQLGRDILDRNRFTESNEGLLFMAEIFGATDVQKIYYASNGEMSLENAMVLINSHKEKRNIW